MKYGPELTFNGKEKIIYMHAIFKGNFEKFQNSKKPQSRRKSLKIKKEFNTNLRNQMYIFY